MSKTWGTVGSFESPAELVRASKAVCKEGYTRFDTYTPFPVHGIEKAMGVPDTKLPWIVLLMGISGCALGTGLQWFANSVEVDVSEWYLTGYQFVVSGKPPFHIVPSIPVIFELTVLLSAFGAVGGILLLSRLPMWHHPLFSHKPFKRVSDDRFFIAVEAIDSHYHSDNIRELLEKLGASDIEEIYEEDDS